MNSLPFSCMESEYMQMKFIRIYDILHHIFESKKTQRYIALSLITVFLASLLCIELNKFHLIPHWASHYIPTNPFASIALVFTLVLLVEVIGLVFTIAYSLSKTLQMQLEILALILIRQAFKGLSTLEETFFIEPNFAIVSHVILPALTAMFIFICISVFKIFKKVPIVHIPEATLFQYITIKKIISLGVLCGVVSIIGYMSYRKYVLHKDLYFFEAIYSLLIFADILLILVAQYYFPSFLIMFRNSAFVVCTLFIRIALTSKIEWMCAMGSFAGLYAVLVGWFTSYFSQREENHKKEFSERKNYLDSIKQNILDKH